MTLYETAGFIVFFGAVGAVLSLVGKRLFRHYNQRQGERH